MKKLIRACSNPVLHGKQAIVMNSVVIVSYIIMYYFLISNFVGKIAKPKYTVLNNIAKLNLWTLKKKKRETLRWVNIGTV